MKFSFLKLAKNLVIVAVASLFLRRGLIRPYTLQPFEVLTVLATLSLLIALLLGQVDKTGQIQIKKWLTIIGTLFFLMVLGVINSYFIYGLTPRLIKHLTVDFALIVPQLAIFIMIIYFGIDPQFRQRLTYAFLLPILFVPFIFFPELALRFDLLEYKNYFWGFHSNFVLFASWCLVAMYYLILQTKSHTEIWQKLFYWLLTMLLLSIMIWSGSRSTWLGLFISYIFLIYIYTKSTNKIDRILVFIKYGTVALATVVFAFLILPQHAQIAALVRFYPQLSGHSTAPWVLEKVNLSEAFDILAKDPVPTLPAQGRTITWPQSIKLLSQNPWGLGPEYNLTSQGIVEIIPDFFTGTKKTFPGAHNSLLEIALAGGYGALIIFLFMLGQAWNSIKKTVSEDYSRLVWSMAFLSLFIVSMFHGILRGLPWFWVVLAVVIVQNPNPNWPNSMRNLFKKNPPPSVGQTNV